MKTKNKLSAYILRGSTGPLLFSCAIVALCSAINLPEQLLKTRSPQDSAAFGTNAYQRRSLSFADRVAYQTAIEDVYWRHRIWPKTNPGPKPALYAVMSQAQLEKKVEDYLRDSQTLEAYWQRPITADQLQAEMEHMASHTKQREVLLELFEALGNDPFVIAECLARPVLAERLVKELYAQGQRFHSEDADLAQSDASAVVATPLRGVARNMPQARGYSERLMTMAGASSANYTLPVIASPSGDCTDDTWTTTTLTNAPSARDSHTAVWTGSEMVVWGGFPGLDTGAKYDPATDSWTATSTSNAPSGRYGHTAVWTGSEMIVWGSFSGLNTGGRYNPIDDSWTATSTTNAPSGRGNHTAVWTGSEMIVWGGGEQTNTGGRYDPISDSWIATGTTNAPEGRYWHTAVWSGSEMIVWGGWNGSFFINTGGRYDPGTDSWTATTTTKAPIPRGYIYCEEQGAVWTGSEMIVWGGSDGGAGFNTGGRYDPPTDSWTATNVSDAPVGRTQHGTVWTGSEMIVWGGMGPLNTGGRYNPSTDSWTATSTTDAPSGRRLHTAVWTDSEMIVWGGSAGGTRFNTGGRYCASAPSPTPTPTSSPSPTATATPTATPTPSPTPTPTPSPTPTPTPPPTPTPTATPTPTPPPTPTPTATPSVTPPPRPIPGPSGTPRGTPPPRP